MEDLLKGQHFCTSLDEQIAFEQLSYSESAVWSLLLAGGYLKIAGFSGRDSEDYENGIEDYGFAFREKEVRIDGGYIKNLRLPGELENRVR